MRKKTTYLDPIMHKASDSLMDVLASFDTVIDGKSNPAGIALIVDKNQSIVGTITDGDVRRALLKRQSINLSAGEIMQKSPIVLPDTLSLNEIPKQLAIALENKGRKAKKFLNYIILVDELNRPTRLIDYHQLWEQRIAIHRHIAILGLGYVGLTLALALADKGYLITGLDIDKKKLEQLTNGDSYIHEGGLPELLHEHIGKNFKVSHELPDDVEVFIISVGTPVNSTNGKKPTLNMDYLEDSLRMIGKNLKRGNLIVLRSTVPIGTCRSFAIPKLEKLSGLKCGVDFHVSFAPERTAEGNAIKELHFLPQIIGGFNKDSIEATVALFKELTPTIVRVDSLESAEMVKLVNNSFRDYIFAYANFITEIASNFNVDINRVIKAANQGYPRDRIPFPSPGVGGACLTKDPFIFASATEKIGIPDRIFANGRAINESMHQYVVQRVCCQLDLLNKSIKKAKILICGLAFKGNPETGDIRESSSIEIALKFKDLTGEVFGFDSVALKEEIKKYGVVPLDIPSGFKDMDVILFLNNHRLHERVNPFEMVRLAAREPIIFDGWNQLNEDDVLFAKPCVYMGLSHVSSSI